MLKLKPIFNRACIFSTNKMIKLRKFITKTQAFVFVD